MCSIWLELGDNRIPMTRNELSELQACIRRHSDLGGIAADILAYLDEQEAQATPIPTNETLVQLAAIASAVRRTPVPEGSFDGIGDAVMDIGAELAETAETWFNDASYSYAIVIRSREQLRHWVDKLRANGYDQYADDMDDLRGRMNGILPELR